MFLSGRRLMAGFTQRILALAIFLLAGMPLVAQWQEPRFDKITIEDGLSHPVIRCIVQDRDGYMWLGSDSGLNRYDGHKVKIYRHERDRSDSLSSSFVNCLFVDGQGTLWVGTNRGLNRYNVAFDRFERFLFDPNESMDFVIVKSVMESKDGTLWVATYGKGLYAIDRATNKTTDYMPIEGDEHSLPSKGVWCSLIDSGGTIWTGTYNGIARYIPETGTFKRYGEVEGIEVSLIRSLCETADGTLWCFAADKAYSYDRRNDRFHQSNVINLPKGVFMGSHVSSDGNMMIATSEGLGRYNTADGQFSFWRPNPFDHFSLPAKALLYAYEDRSGLLWVGADGGAFKFDLRQLRFSNFLIKDRFLDKSDSNIVYSVLETNDGSIWLGGTKGLIQVSRETGEMTHVDIGDKSWIAGLAEDNQGRLWVGTSKNLVKYDIGTGELTRFLPGDEPLSLSNGVVYALLFDRENRLWVGTLDGVDMLPPGSEQFVRFNSDQTGARNLTKDLVTDLMQTSDGTVWIGTEVGLNAYSKGNEMIHYLRDDSRSGSLSNGWITALEEGNDGSLWVGTQDGLNHLDRNGKSFSFYSTDHGLVSSNISGVLCDKQGKVWVSSDKGLSCLDPVSKDVFNLSVQDGLQGNSFQPGAFFKSSKGELFFGGYNGVTSFMPQMIERDRAPAPIRITGFSIFDREIKPKFIDPDSPLEKVIGQTEEIKLTYEDRMIQFTFSVLHYGNTGKNHFEYLLEGLDDHWISEDSGEATFTNLDAGTYTFRVKGAHHHGVWNDGPSVVIRIKPAPWNSWYAYTVYVLIVFMIIMLYIRSQNRKLAFQREINEQQNKVNERLHQLDRFKDEILANTSHELRTPLNGIIGLADSLRDGSAGNLTEAARRDLGTIVSCGKRLSSLINDILDHSRLKNKSLTLSRNAVNLHSVASMVLNLSRPLTGNKDIQLIVAIPENLPIIQGDENRLMQVLHNLVGNAIKFTEKGYVKISGRPHGDKVMVSVSDTGIGIPEDKVEHVFEAFEQGDSSAIRSFGGTGLGLAISKRLVAMHGGEIKVESVLGAGTTFSFFLPVMAGEARDVKDLPITERVFVNEQEEPTERENRVQDTLSDGLGRILVVDDEPVNRKVLVNYLEPQGYEIVEASGGAEALKLISRHDDFDLVLLDIMMPRMSGYEVCRRLREIHSVNELPVIFLSAKNQTSDLLEGFVVGGNDYLAKPITKAELLARVKTHLELLDVNRNLEVKVGERTRELEEKNRKIMEQQEELIRKQRQLVIQEKMASLGTLTAGIAHEINNPVNFAHGSVQNLMVDLERFKAFFFQLAGPEADEDILAAFNEKMSPLFEHSDTILEGTKRISGIVRELQTFSRMDEADIKQVSLMDGIESTLSLVKHNFADSVQFVTRFDDPLDVECWPAEMNQVFMNLIVNGCQAIVTKQEQSGHKGGECLTISTYKEDGCAVIRFQDEGCGISPEVKARIFEPFYTTKVVGEGTGLGLSISYEIVGKHRGRIEVTSDVGIGTTMTIFLPLDAGLVETLN